MGGGGLIIAEYSHNLPNLHVYGSGVLCGAEQHVGRSVPERHHLVTVGLGGHRLGPGKAEVGQLEYWL